jgi:hypothetical protein
MIEQALAAKNRRRSQRRQPKRASKVFCYRGALGMGPNLAVEMLDISEGGIRLRVKEPLCEGQPVLIQLAGLGHRAPLKVMAVVVWCVPAADGSQCVGAHFEKSLRYGDLQLLA